MFEHREEIWMTLEEFDQLPEDNTRRYELIDGILKMQGRPNFYHQAIMGNILVLLKNQLHHSGCHVFTEVEFEVDQRNVIIPDVTVICDLNHTNIQRYQGAAALVVEILSPSNSYSEINDKNIKYRRMGVREIWIVDPERKIITQYTADRPVTYIQQGMIGSAALPGIEISINDIFAS